MYFAEPTILKKEDCPRWWGENEQCFPTLSKLSRAFLRNSATSARTEHIFSAVGNIYDGVLGEKTFFFFKLQE